MTNKAKKRKPMVADADAEGHARLRHLLKDHQAVTYGQLRREHGLSPVFLEAQIAKYPEVFEGPTELSTGRPMIRLKAGKLEAREHILMRRVLVKAVKQAGANGIRLLRLYSSTRIASKDVQRLLEGVPEVSMIRKGRDILYKWTGGKESETSGVPEQSRIQESEQPANPLPEPVNEPDAELETTRQKLVVLLEKTHRHLSWLSNYLDPVAIKRVLERWPQDFETQIADLGVVDLIIRAKCCSPSAASPAVADVLVPSAPQAPSGPEALLEEIFDAETLAQLRFKPGCAGMGRRRNGRVSVRGDRIVR